MKISEIKASIRSPRPVMAWVDFTDNKAMWVKPEKASLLLMLSCFDQGEDMPAVIAMFQGKDTLLLAPPDILELQFPWPMALKSPTFDDASGGTL